MTTPIRTAQEIIAHFSMVPHDEGGYFCTQYRSAECIPQAALPARFTGSRCFSSAILFLLPRGERSRLHRLHQDEVWHFYLGGPLRLEMILPDASHQTVLLGQGLEKGQRLCAVAPAGAWFGAIPAPETEYSLVGCTVAPGFDYADFALGERDALLSMFPQHSAIIEELY